MIDNNDRLHDTRTCKDLIYRVFQCSKCKNIIELALQDSIYTGFCNKCKRNIKVNIKKG